MRWPRWSPRWTPRPRRCSTPTSAASRDLGGLGANRDGCVHRRRDSGLALRSPRWPLDLMLDHSTLERVARDPEELSRLHDASCFLQRGLAQSALGLTEVQVFQEDRHETRICEKSLVGKLFLVMSHTDTAEDDTVGERRWIGALGRCLVRKRAMMGEDAPISQPNSVSMRDTDRLCALVNAIRRPMYEFEQSLIHYTGQADGANNGPVGQPSAQVFELRQSPRIGFEASRGHSTPTNPRTPGKPWFFGDRTFAITMTGPCRMTVVQ